MLPSDYKANRHTCKLLTRWGRWGSFDQRFLVNLIIHFRKVLATLGESAREEVGEDTLDEREDEDMPDRRHGDDEDDRERDQGQQVLGSAPQRSHLARLERVALRSARDEPPRVLEVGRQELAACHVKRNALPNLADALFHIGGDQRPFQLGTARSVLHEAQASLEVLHLARDHPQFVLVELQEGRGAVDVWLWESVRVCVRSERDC